MNKRIEIKPGDQSLIGTKVKRLDWDDDCFITIDSVDSVAPEMFLAIDCRGMKDSWNFEESWYLYEDPLPSNIILKDGKKYKVMSPALIPYNVAVNFSIVLRHELSRDLFHSLEDAKTWLKMDDFQWPALDGNGNPIQYLVEVTNV